MRTAIEERGVAVIVLPGDVALSDGPAEHPSWTECAPPSILPAQADLDRLADLLNASEAVTIMCGSGAQGAHDEVVALADMLGAPVVHALRGKQFIEWDNPYDVGMTGLIGFSSGYHAMMSCDTLLLLGCDFPYRPFYPRRREDRPDRLERLAARPSRAACAGAGRHGQGDRRRDAAAARSARRTAPSSTTRASTMRRRARDSTISRRRRVRAGRSTRNI